jgi:acyl-CoA thioester hydrolase
MQVRPNEVDAFGVVNNTVYAQYMLHARHLLMEAVGCSVETLRNTFKVKEATIKMDINFKHPLRPGDRYYTEAIVEEVTDSSYQVCAL